MKTFNVAAPGNTEADATDAVMGGWFTSDIPPDEAIQAVKAHGGKLFRFKLTVECLGEIKT